MRKKNTIVTLLLVLGLLSITIGVSVAFFNYTRTGSENVLAVGRIYFNSSQGTAINLTNVFPVKSTELENNSNVSSVTLTITGDTTYDEGLEYLVSADQVVNTVNSKTVPIGTSVTVSNLGTSDDSYFTNRGGNSSLYKILSKGNIKEDGELVVGYITKGATGVNGSVTVSAWIDGDKLAISDTYDSTESDNMGTTDDWVNERTVLTTTEWNSLQSSGVSFKLRVEANEGIWVVEPFTSYGQIIKNVSTPTQINYANNSSSANGEGLYILPGTENDTNPIYYYRGNVNNNNVLFAGYCWQIVRTTDTGGIKIIYNGKPVITGSGENITYDCGTTRPVGYIGEVKTTTDLSQNSGYFYADDYEVVSGSGRNIIYRLKEKNNPITQVAITSSNASTAILTIVSNYPYTCKETTSSGTCTTLYQVDSYASGTLAYVYPSSSRSSIGNSAFNTSDTSVSDIGYMSNTRYPYSGSNWTTDALFGSDANWNGNSYTLTDANTTTPDSTHHYSCNATTADATCTELRYVYYVNGSTKNYIMLTGGEMLEDALYKMTGNGTDAIKTRNSSYRLNVNDSTAKYYVDNWFKTYLTNEINANNINYQTYLEDTIYCDSRDYKTVSGYFPVFNQSGWNSNGGSLTQYIFFEPADRARNNWYSETNTPKVECPKEVDRFTVSRTKGNGDLKYPVGLLTSDEIVMAGAGGNGSSNTNYYLYTGDYFWSMSSCAFDYSYAYVYLTYDDGHLGYPATDVIGGLRPVVSLKPGIEFEDDGDGTPTNPYIVKYN